MIPYKMKENRMILKESESSQGRKKKRIKSMRNLFALNYRSRRLTVSSLTFREIVQQFDESYS